MPSNAPVPSNLLQASDEKNSQNCNSFTPLYFLFKIPVVRTFPVKNIILGQRIPKDGDDLATGKLFMKVKTERFR